MRTTYILYALCLSCILPIAGCSKSGENKPQCQKDGDCPANWRCDIYSLQCRCVDDRACDAGRSERCMPDGTCQIYVGCQRDEDCGGCNRCNTETSECLCMEDCGCPTGEVCNESGYCQASVGCFDNADCKDNEICDVYVAAGQLPTCIAGNTCTSKMQCPLGQVCNAGSCASGCEDHGDCPLRRACIGGSCLEGACADDSFCEFMERCQAGNCTKLNPQTHPLCKPCTAASQCGDRANQCANYPYTDDPFAQVSQKYCTLGCSDDNPCPNGFDCNQAIGVTQENLCSPYQGCSSGTRCILEPEADQGYCECDDAINPCPGGNTCMNSATCSGGTCWLLGLVDLGIPCNTDADCIICFITANPCASDADCPQIQCEQIYGQDYKGCVMSETCGLKEGFHCPVP